MRQESCTTSPQELLAYWLGELGESDERRLEEHLFACAACSEELQAIVELGAMIRGALLGGNFGCVLPASFIHRLKDTGVRVREYTLAPGASVECTVTPDDDLVVAYLSAPLRDVRRLDLLIDDPEAGTRRASDVGFDPEAGDVVAVPSTSYLRTLGHTQLRMRLVAVEGAEERLIADYTFNHHPS